jgi:hypothetical protein
MRTVSKISPWRRGLLEAALAAIAAGLAAGPAAAGVLFPNAGPAVSPPAATAPDTPDKAGGDKPAGAKTLKSHGRTVAAGMECFRLPPDFRNADGTFNQESITAQQKKRLEVINEMLGVKLRLSETPHYLLFSDADAAMTAQFMKWSEALYTSLGAQFGIEPKERIWDGKCILIIFRSRAKFQEFARRFDENNAANAGAFFAWEHYEEGNLPECVHICIPLDERDPKRLQELFAHEGTHAFFQLFHRPVELPLWLHEGLAEYMTVVNDPNLRAPKTAPAVAAARSGMPLQRLLDARTGTDLRIQEYSVAFTLVDYLQQAGKGRFRKFITLLKDGKGQDAAMKTAYGFDTAGMADRWRAALASEGLGQRRR